jgi:hypothetical protein
MRKGTINIHILDSDKYPFGVDFLGCDEGSGSPCCDESEVELVVKGLVERHKDYNLKIIDERVKQMTLF